MPVFCSLRPSILAILLCAAGALQAALFVYVANGRSDSISVIDTAAGSKLSDIVVGQLPWGVVIR